MIFSDLDNLQTSLDPDALQITGPVWRKWKLICQLESQGVISKTRSPFNSPIWPVRKPNGKWRLTVDYRGLNQVAPPLNAAVPDMLQLHYELESKEVKGPAQEIQFLAIKWQDGRRQIPKDVINKITAMSPPTNKKETQTFLGIVGFWRMHIPGYSQIVSPLYEVTRKKNDFKWGPEQQSAFEQIKREIVHAVALGPVQTGQDLDCNASNFKELIRISFICISQRKILRNLRQPLMPERHSLTALEERARLLFSGKMPHIASVSCCFLHRLDPILVDCSPLNELWQTDVTHISAFGVFRFVHVTVDTFSGFIVASAHRGEKAKDVCRHWLCAIAVLSIPQKIKTDNGPGYIARWTKTFLAEWGILHITGPYWLPARNIKPANTIQKDAESVEDVSQSEDKKEDSNLPQV
ncbi:hypothetical protein llap_16472 [Limosa lapponica baueri]|uniref:Integrase catalytic domain-containing protein n=1 Tax=Limosa lapponica baueri TaxID=1758121 RepID=A0A2I0THE9_LIMLA|nr:hypothetical protein llap_16472 [Limosa lapponica baueri]